MAYPDYKIAFVDIENSPNLAWVWGKYEQNVLEFEREWHMMSFAVKWAHQRKVTCYALPDFPLYDKDPFNDSALLGKLWEVFDEADLIIGHNIINFDIRKANARYVKHLYGPPSPYETFDTLREARRHFMFSSNKLGDLARFLGVGAKVEVERGIGLWLKCLRGDELAWSRMKRYNSNDVKINESVYERLRPWSKNHPNINLKGHKDFLCPACGSETVRNGWRLAKSFRTKAYKCKNPECGKWSQGAREKLPIQVLR